MGELADGKHSEVYAAKFRWTVEEGLVSVRHHLRLRSRKWMGIILLIGFLVNSAIAISEWRGAATVVFIVLNAGLCCFVVLMIERFNIWWTGRSFHNRPGANCLIRLEFSQQGIRQECEGIGSADLQWKAFTDVLEVKDGFLLYQNASTFHWIPFYAFERPEGVEKVREFIKANGVKFKSKRR